VVVESKYTVTRRHVFTFEDVRKTLKEAHEHCKRTVKAVPHRVGKARRLVISPPRKEYLDCIQKYIYDKMEKIVGEKIPPK